MDYEGQICRAPMERSSFMLPVMVGCSYNQCKFCNLFYSWGRHPGYSTSLGPAFSEAGTASMIPTSCRMT